MVLQKRIMEEKHCRMKTSAEMVPKVSIIVPVYNAEKYLFGCIGSVLGQSYSDFEMLLVDDGSIDDSGRICDEFGVKDHRIRVFHQKNGGVSSARNLGLDNAQGDWVCFVDADDELMPEGLKVMTDGISSNVDLVMSGYEILEEDGNKIYSIEKRICKIITNAFAMKEMFWPVDYRYQGYIWGKLYSMSVIKANRLRFAEDIYFNEDRLFVTQYICSSGKDVSYTTIPVYKYYERQNSAMMSLKKSFNPKFVTDFEAQIKMRELVRKTYEDDELYELADYGVYNSYRMIVGLMKETRCLDDLLSSKLRLRLIGIIGQQKYVRYEIQRNKSKVVKKIRKLF